MGEKRLKGDVKDTFLLLAEEVIGDWGRNAIYKKERRMRKHLDRLLDKYKSRGVQRERSRGS